MRHIEVITAEWCAPSQGFLPVVQAVAKDYPEVQVRYLEAEELAAFPSSVPILRLVVDGKKIRQTMGSMPVEVIREFFEASMVHASDRVR